jgi:hypothetical protein
MADIVAARCARRRERFGTVSYLGATNVRLRTRIASPEKPGVHVVGGLQLLAAPTPVGPMPYASDRRRALE